jgi:hypothetical protein
MEAMRNFTLILSLVLLSLVGAFNYARAVDDSSTDDSSGTPKHHGHHHHKCDGGSGGKESKDAGSDKTTP